MKLLGIAVAVFIVAGAGGVAYACGGGGGGPCGQGWFSDGHECEPVPSLEWTSPSGTTPGTAVQCTLSLTSSELYVLVAGLAPGKSCVFYAVLENVGKANAKLTESVTVSAPSKCPDFTYSDNVATTPAPVINAGGHLSFHGTVGLTSSAGSACEGAVATFSVTITGSPSGCGSPYSQPLGPAGSIASWKPGW